MFVYKKIGQSPRTLKIELARALIIIMSVIKSTGCVSPCVWDVSPTSKEDSIGCRRYNAIINTIIVRDLLCRECLRRGCLRRMTPLAFTEVDKHLEVWLTCPFQSKWTITITHSLFASSTCNILVFLLHWYDI